MHQIDTDSDVLTTQDDSLYPYVNNDIEYGLFEDIVESYHLDSQIKDDFQCDPDCYTQTSQLTKDNHPNLYQVCSDFCILNEKLVKINHAFPLVRDCIEQLGRKKCHYLSTIDTSMALCSCYAIDTLKF